LAGTADCAAIYAGALARELSTPLERGMSAIAQITKWQNAAKQRHRLTVVLICLPFVMTACALAWRFLSMPGLIVVTVFCFISVLVYAWHSSKTFDAAWLTRKLDTHLKDLDDSSDLLFKKNNVLSSLQTLQQQRVEERILQLRNVDLRKQWPWKNISIVWIFGFSVFTLVIFWPQAKNNITQFMAAAKENKTTSPSAIRLTDQTVTIKAPAYTSLPERNEKTLQVKFPEGATLNWKITFQPQPASVNLLFLDGTRLALKRKGDAWQGARKMLQSNLYRIQVNTQPLAQNTLYRLDVIKDRAPQIRVSQPDRGLSIFRPGQNSWPLSFEAEDDYGLGAAQLTIRLAQGSGENINFKEQSQILSGQGTRKQKRYTNNLNLAALGIGPGDDVIVQFSIRDLRQPETNTTRSASFILRWPPQESTETVDVEGMVKKVLPAYFRSQRQIIIDTEKLVAEKNKFNSEQFSLRADGIGVDQRILRLRYGQFLGEETEAPKMPTNDAEDETKHEADDGHDHTESEPKQDFTPTANDQTLLEEFGHTHDIPEAATLLDPAIKILLRAALNEMWQAELYLRSGEPKKALPYENRALGFIKKFQQADRVYLARVGNELSPIDESRRLSGDRKGLQNRLTFLQPAEQPDAVLMNVWQTLDQYELASNRKTTLNFSALRVWLRENPARVSDALSLLAAIDAVEQKPDCKTCRQSMKQQLWLLLKKPPANAYLRTLPNRKGQRYLEALRQERAR
jgi:hypothetical protein